VVTDPAARYFGAVIDGGSIVPGGGATLFETSFTEGTQHDCRTGERGMIHVEEK
jgi:hypothetical protein